MICRRTLAAAAFVCAAGHAGFGLAQEREGYTVTSQQEAPRSATTEAYLPVARWFGAETDVTYADGLEGDLSEGAAVPSRGSGRTFSFGGGNGFGVLAVVAGLIAALLLWLKFGGTGVLLSRAPREIAVKPEAPEGWKLSGQETEMDAQSLLAMLANMKDRREALVRMLRHCLLKAAADSETRFARSDTEREAFARLPKGWHFRQPLAALLRDTELAHYGGRDVSADVFARNMEIARAVLTGGRTPGHA